MGNELNRDLSRRDFLKVAGATAGVAALASAGLTAKPTAAFADVTAEGTYTVTANVYVDKADTPIGANAYVTNAGNPPFNKPTTPVSNNATLIIQEGKKLLTAPIVNNTFGVLSIAGASADGVVKVAGTTQGTWNPPFPWSTPYANRITSITFDVTDFAGGGAVATFSPCSEYATFPLYKGDKTWDLHLVANLSSVA